MALKSYSCRTHGGVFKMQARRGRPPVRCTEENLCSRANEETPQQSITVESESEPRSTSNPSVLVAKAAKERLVALGWSARGKTGATEAGGSWATLTASRGEETLIINWSDGALVDQHYSLFSDKDVAEEKLPGKNLDLNPDELTDRELVNWIRGMKVTWWNTLAGSTETAVVGGKVYVEHIFDQGENHDNTKRLVKFLDHNGGGFRAFHVSAMMKVG